MISKRFKKPVVLTYHAAEQMAERHIDKDGNIVQIVILEAKEKGLYPVIPMKMLTKSRKENTV